MARDLVADQRDVAADGRDRHAEVHARELSESGAAVASQAAESARTAAAADRLRAAEDRDQAGRDRDSLQVQLDRVRLDPLTGAYGRSVGEVVLRQEMERAWRSKGGLILAYADVDGLKAINDAEGHAEGDALLRDAVAAIRSKLRPYDPIVRWGGDEFVCTFPEEIVGSGAARMSEVDAALRVNRPSASVTIGLGSLRDEDSLESLMERADRQLRRHKSSRSPLSRPVSGPSG